MTDDSRRPDGPPSVPDARACAGGRPHVDAATLGALLRPLHALALAQPDRPALHFAGRTFGYGKFWSRIERVSAHLAVSWGVRAGDRVATLCLNHDLQLAMLFACARLGAIFVPLNFRLAVPELQDIAADAGLKAVFSDQAHADAANVVAAHGAIAHAPIERLIDTPAPLFPPGLAIGPAAADAAALLLVYTSGTTGAPKGAVHTQAGVLANARASWWAHGMTQADHVLSTLPMFHVGGLCIQTVPALLAGALVTLHDRFSAQAWLDAVAARRPTLSLMVPATLRAVLEHADWPRSDLSSLRGVMAGSSTIPLTYIDAFHARGVPMGQVYGATETGPVSIVLRLPEAMSRPGCAGWAQPEVSVRIVDGEGADVADGAVGEIWLRGANVMSGYWGQPPLRDGWFRSGDLAHAHADGCIEVVGRSKDMIISGGENIYPAEIENVLAGMADVQECAVVGLPDAHWGEVPVAVIVPAPQADRAALQTEALRQTLSGHIARFKLPRRAVLADALPKSALGKVLKPQLRAWLIASGDPER